LKRIFDDKKYFFWGLTAFLVIIASILFFMLLQHWQGVKAELAAFFAILSPIIWGAVIAYLLQPVQNFFEKKIFTPLLTRLCKKKPERVPSIARACACGFSVLLLIVVIVALLWLLLPQVYTSIEALVVNIPNYAQTVGNWIESAFDGTPELEGIAVSMLDNLSSSVTNWAKESILPQIEGLLTNITTGIYRVVRGTLNVLIGIVISLYLMHNREKFISGAKKIIYSIFSPARAKNILRGVRYTDDVFMSFISGKLIDSLIIGVLCYIGCAIMKMPYALLVSVIVGVTNIIPFFGPFIGAVPSAFIILMVSPIKSLVFIIFIIVLQQFDGNILGPKILGSRVGLNGFWIMVAIIVGGGLFGFAGMLLGVPVLTVILAGLRHLVNNSLRKRGFSTDNREYENLNYIDPNTGEMIHFEEKTNAGEVSPADADNAENSKAGE
jgi:predicted PurR-regulated permease PerM